MLVGHPLRFVADVPLQRMAECSGHLVVIATYPRHLDPVIDSLLVAAWDASEGVCMRCGSNAVTTTPLCSAHILGRGV